MPYDVPDVISDVYILTSDEIFELFGERMDINLDVLEAVAEIK